MHLSTHIYLHAYYLESSPGDCGFGSSARIEDASGDASARKLDLHDAFTPPPLPLPPSIGPLPPPPSPPPRAPASASPGLVTSCFSRDGDKAPRAGDRGSRQEDAADADPRVGDAGTRGGEDARTGEEEGGALATGGGVGRHGARSSVIA